MRRTLFTRTATGLGTPPILAHAIVVLLMAVMAQAAYAADRMSTQPAGGTLGGARTTVPAVPRSDSPDVAHAGGRITFLGAVRVGTAATPVTVAASPGASATVILRAGRYAAPSRQVAVRPFQHRELSPEIKRLELPGEQLGPMQEAIVMYR